MNTPADAAKRVLGRAREQRFDDRSARIVALAAVIADDPWREDFLHPGNAFAAAAVECRLAVPNRDRFEALAGRVPATERATVLSSLEWVLAGIDPGWAWSVLLRSLGEASVFQHPLLGLQIAARLDPDESADLLGKKLAVNPLFARQYRADSFGRTHSPHGAEELRTANLYASECNAVLAGVAAADARAGCILARQMLQSHSPNDLSPALDLVAEAARLQGKASDIISLITAAEFLTTRAVCLEAAAKAGLLESGKIADLAEHLSSQVDDELEPSRRAIAGVPILVSLACAEQNGNELIETLALRWRIPPQIIADRLFDSGCTRRIRLPFQVLDVPEANWNRVFRNDFAWWRAVPNHHKERAGACQDMMTIAAASPWKPLPGTLADIVHFAADPVVREKSPF